MRTTGLEGEASRRAAVTRGASGSPSPDEGISSQPLSPPAATAGREPWRLLVTWEGEPGWNMALDEALLARADPRPVLRFYTWAPAALSLGYFQRFDELAHAVTDAVIVRRPSGGGAICHDADELTFSIAAAREHPLFRGEVRHSYERVHGWLARAFAGFGVRAALRGAEPVGSDVGGTGMCFHRSTPLDLIWDGAKGVGSAQRRRGGRVLHHGSIKLGAGPLERGVATLRAHAPRLTARTLAAALAQAAEREWGCALERTAPDDAELAHAARRAGAFPSAAFVRRR
jgi:lipoate-protein ligase A